MASPSPPEPPAATDGRTARSRRSGAAIVTALLDLILEGDPQPTAQRIADRAGLSVRSVFGHYASLEDLHRAATERVSVMVIERISPIDPSEPVEVKIELLCGQRARINEELGPLIAAADRHQGTSPELARSRRYGRTASREQLERVFARELDGLVPGARRRVVAGIDVLLAPPSWRLLRGVHGLGPDEARVALAESLAALLPAVASG